MHERFATDEPTPDRLDLQGFGDQKNRAVQNPNDENLSVVRESNPPRARRGD
jgi:hypothetical protein